MFTVTSSARCSCDRVWRATCPYYQRSPFMVGRLTRKESFGPASPETAGRCIMRRIFLGMAALALLCVTAETASARPWYGVSAGYGWGGPYYGVSYGTGIGRNGFLSVGYTSGWGGYGYYPAYGYSYVTPVTYTTPVYDTAPVSTVPVSSDATPVYTTPVDYDTTPAYYYTPSYY